MRVNLVLLAVMMSLGFSLPQATAQTTVSCQRVAPVGPDGANVGGWLGVFASVVGGGGNGWVGGAQNIDPVLAYVPENTADSNEAGDFAYSEHTQRADCFLPIGAWDSAPQVDTLLTATSTITGPNSATSQVGYGSNASAASLWQVNPSEQSPALNLEGALRVEAEGVGANAMNGIQIQVVCGTSSLVFASRGDAWIANGVIQQATVANPTAPPINVVNQGYPPTFTLVVPVSEVVAPGQAIQISGLVTDGAGAGEGSVGTDYNIFFKGSAWFTVKTP